MGTIPLTSVSGQKCEEKNLMEKMDYIQNLLVPQLGYAEIFRFKQAPYDYLIKHVRAFDESNPQSKAYMDRVTRAASMQQHKNIATIHYYKVEKTLTMCAKGVTVETYSNYYAITLRQVIEQRKKADIRFTVGETWYVLKNLVEVSSFLKANSFTYGAYKPQNITLSAEGYIKLYVLHLNQGLTQKSHPYFQALCDRRNIVEHLPLPQEFLPMLMEGKQQFTPNHEKEDSFYIGLVIMQMLIDEDIRKYYSLNSSTFCTFKRDTLEKDALRLRSVYGDQMMDLLLGMLCQNIENRITPTQAMEYIKEHREELTLSGALRMFEDEHNQIKPKMSYRTSLDIENSLKAFEQNVLENKLTPGPIRTFTKKSHQVTKSSCGVSLTSSKKTTQTKDFSNFRERPSDVRGSSLRNRLPSLNVRMPR